MCSDLTLLMTMTLLMSVYLYCGRLRILQITTTITMTTKTRNPMVTPIKITAFFGIEAVVGWLTLAPNVVCVLFFSSKAAASVSVEKKPCLNVC